LTVERDARSRWFESGGSVTQQTMLYDSREKHGAAAALQGRKVHDYRYFPEPDLPPLVLTPEFVAEQQSELPELPAQKRERFVASYALSRSTRRRPRTVGALPIIRERGPAPARSRKARRNWVMTEALADAKDYQDQLRVAPVRSPQLIALVKGGTLSHQAAKKVFGEVAAKGATHAPSRESLGLIQVGTATSCRGGSQTSWGRMRRRWAVTRMVKRS